MFLRVLDVFRSPIPYSFRSKYYSQVDTLQTNLSALERSFSTTNWQDAQTGSSEASAWSHTWINNFVLVDGKDKLGNLKLRICLDPTNLNKAIVQEPYLFKTPEDIAHLFADACIMSVCDCKKGYWHQGLMKLHPSLQLSTLSLWDLDIL